MGWFGKSAAERVRALAEEAMAWDGGPQRGGYSVGMSSVTTCALGEGMVSVSIRTEGQTVILTLDREQALRFAQDLLDATGG